MSVRDGDLWRLVHPLVQDLIGGIAQGKPAPQPRLVAPPHAARPELEPQVGGWPPEAGSYDKQGLAIGTAGELARLGLALTFPEVRAFVMGLGHRVDLDAISLRSVVDMASALSEVVGKSKLRRAAFVEAWESLFYRGASDLARSGSSDGLQPVRIDLSKAAAPGVYLADAAIGISSPGLGGSLRISATYLRADILKLIKSDRRLAQLPPEFRGVGADFVVCGESNIGVQVTGLRDKRLTWEVNLSLRRPILKGGDR